MTLRTPTTAAAALATSRAVTIFASLALVFLLTLGGCEEKSPIEKAGDKVEDAADEVGDAVEDAADEVEDAVDDKK